jgi:transposase
VSPTEALGSGCLSLEAEREVAAPEVTIGLDLGERFSRFCQVGRDGRKMAEGRVATTRGGLREHFERLASARVVIEVGTHSPWVSRLLSELGHQVLVANPRKLRLIYDERRKSDRLDAEKLARLGRLDPHLLSAVTHRSQEAAEDLAVLRARDALVRTRSAMINHVRGALKSIGVRLTGCSPETIHARALPQVPLSLRPALEPVLETIAVVGEQIRQLEVKVGELLAKYPETQLPRQVHGIGPLIALAFVLTIEDPRRFQKSRTVGAYLGLIPGRGQSGDSDPQRRITKEGDPLLRRLLVQGAHYVLGPFGPDCDLRRFGLAVAARGSKNAKKRAVVAVARKLAVLLHRLWKTGEVYEPLRTRPEAARPVAA